MKSRKNGCLIAIVITVAACAALVVILIVVAAVLFPVLARARETARKTVCFNNERQLGMAFVGYSRDYDDRFPPVDGSSSWAGKLTPYLRGTAAFRCPDDKTAPNNSSVAISYGYNRNIKGLALSRMKSPARTVEGFEVNGVLSDLTTPSTGPATTGVNEINSATGNGVADLLNGGGNSIPGASYETGQMNGAANNGPPTGPHLDGANTLFVDGHVDWLKGSAISPGDSSANSSAPQAAPTSELRAPVVATFSPN